GFFFLLISPSPCGLSLFYLTCLEAHLLVLVRVGVQTSSPHHFCHVTQHDVLVTRQILVLVIHHTSLKELNNAGQRHFRHGSVHIVRNPRCRGHGPRVDQRRHQVRQQLFTTR